MRLVFHVGGLLVPLCLTLAVPVRAGADAIQRMQLPRLEAMHASVEALKGEHQKVTLESGLKDYRAILHCHSAFSHDSRGTIERVVQAAKAVGVNVILFTEHPADHYDYIADGHKGMMDGVLLIPGAESGGFLAYPKTSLKGIRTSSPQEFADLVARTGGLTFLSHLEERMDWNIAGMTGNEIYNTHADFKEEKRLAFLIASPLSWSTIKTAIDKYPQEFFAALQDYPRDYLGRWDELCHRAPHTGVAANDSHENIGIVARLIEGEKVRVEDALGERIADFPLKAFPLLQGNAADKKVGDIVFEMRLDPYERSFHHVSTHLLMPKLDTDEVWSALQEGRAYVGFDWMADPTGFVFLLEHGADRFLMGSRVALAGGAGVPWRLRVAAPFPCDIKILRDGTPVAEASGRAFDFPITEPGIYRAECWLTLGGESRPWILSNPIYVRAGEGEQAPPAAEAAKEKPPTAMVPMADGTRLATDVHLPKNHPPPYPVLYASGPYGRPPGRGMARALTERGYAVVLQDMRGRFQSEGSDAIIFHHHGWAKNKDGHDTLRWIAAQPWCDGKIGTFGGSALGITQNMLAPGAPGALKAQFVEVAFSDMYGQCAYQGGAWRRELIEAWLAATKMSPANLESFVAHPNRDAFWSELSPEGQAERIDVPATYLAGWYDIFLQGGINSFRAAQHQGGPRARGNCRLVIGPWAHGTFDQLVYPENSKRDRVPAADANRFFDHWLRGADNGVATDLPVHYYLMGDPTDTSAPGNTWIAAADWPPPAESIPYYLHVDGALGTSAPATDDGARAYDYDPKNPVPTIGGQNLTILKGPMDQRPVESRSDVLVFTSEVLTEPLAIVGPIVAQLFVSSDCPDTDFTVKLSDVYPDGRSMLVADGIKKAGHRVSDEREDFLETGAVYELEVDLWSTALVLAKGHRLRVAVSSSNSPRFEPNPNTGHRFRADEETRIAHNTIHLSRSRPSAIRLPIHRTVLSEARAASR